MSGGGELARARILVVDDEPFDLELAGDALGTLACEVTLVRDGRGALRALEAAEPRFDVVLLDRRMPPPDGLEILRHMRASQRLAGTPVILQTAAADPSQVAEGIAAGATFYLTKPFKGAALVALVRAALAQRRELDAMREQAADCGLAVGLMRCGRFQFRTVDQVGALAHALSGLCAQPDMVRLGLAELMVNAIEHGNLAIGFEAKSELMRTGRWREEVERRSRDARFQDRVATIEVEQLTDLVRFVIRDQGEGFEWRDFMDMPGERATRPNGRGIALARKLSFLSVNYRDDGREVEAAATPAPRVQEA